MDKKWNLQDIKPAERRQRPRPPEARVRRETTPRQPVEEADGTMRIEIADGKAKRGFSYFVAIGVFFAVVFTGIGIGFLTAGADVSVFPRHRTPNINAEFVASKTPQVGELSYEILSLEANTESQVAATGQEEVSELATGKLLITKTTPGAQRLIKNTRFESPAGLIYRITETVVVPGAVSESPGSIQADVFADSPGEAYNLNAARLTVPGLEDDEALFSAISAEVSEPIVGGFEGKKFIIDDAELATAKQSLQMELRDALLERVAGEKPAGFVAFDSAVAFTYETLPAVEYGEDLATLKESAVLQIPLFKEDDFAAFIAAAAVPGYEGVPVRIDNYEDLAFSYTSPTTSSSNIANMDSLEFKLVGKPLIVWVYDEGKLSTDLVGAAKTALPSILGGYPAIEKAEAVIRPFWKRSFPTAIDNITITEVVESGGSGE